MLIEEIFAHIEKVDFAFWSFMNGRSRPDCKSIVLVSSL